MGNSSFSCLRKTFCWLNIIFWLCSCAILGAGFWLHLSYKGYATLLPNHVVLSADTIFLGIGGLGFIISFLGCCGAWIQLRCFFFIYFLFILILFLSEFLVGSIAFAFRGGIGRVFSNELRFGIENHYNASDRGPFVIPSVASIWDNLQQSFKCCGVSSYEDWYGIQSWNGKRWVPESCCKNFQHSPFLITDGRESEIPCGRSENPHLWWDKGCMQSMQEWFLGQIDVVGAIMLGIAFVQLFGLISSLLLFCSKKENEIRTEKYKSYTTSIDQQQTNSWED